MLKDWILIEPDRPKGGGFDPGESFINQTAVIKEVGPLVSDEIQALVGKRVVYTAWKCEEILVDKVKHYMVPESANALCKRI